MARNLFSFVLVCALACQAAAEPVSELLMRAAKSPLGAGEARLLRAVADLIEKEQAAATAPTSLPAPQAVQPEERQRLAFRLNNAPVDDVVNSLEEFLKSQQRLTPADESAPRPGKVILVPEQVTNTLLISGPPKLVASLSQRIAKLDTRPDMVAVRVVIANFKLTPKDAESPDGLSDDKVPSQDEDAAAWLEWASKQGRLEVLSRPQIMTLVNQPAFIQIGAVASRKSIPKPNEPKTGITAGLTPHISPDRRIVMELDVEQASILTQDGAGEPIISKTTVQTTLSAKDGQTVVLGGMTEHGKDGRRQLIIAVTPRLIPYSPMQ